MERLLPVIGTVRMPPGITTADITVTYLSVLRGGGMVSGGTIKAFAGADGVPKVGDGPLVLQVAFAEDFVERHPFAKFAVSYRGPAAGYEFLVDLALDTASASVNISKPVGDMQLMTAEQAKTITQILADANAAAEEARLRAENLGGIRQLSVTPLYVELFDTTQQKLTPSTFTLPNGVVLETVTIEGVN